MCVGGGADTCVWTAVDLAMLAAAAGVRSNTEAAQGNSSEAVQRMLENAEADAHPLVAAVLQQQVGKEKRQELTNGDAC